MGRKSLTRKQILHYEEPFVRAMKMALRWVIANYVTLLIVLGIVLAGAFGYVTWQNQRYAVAVKTSKDLTDAIEALQDLMNRPPDDPEALRKALAEVEKQFIEVRDRYAGTTAAHEAEYHLGQIALYRGDFKQAVAHFEKGKALPEPLRSLARLGLAQALAESGKVDEALNTLKVLEADPNRSVGDDLILFYRSRFYALKGDTKQARSIFESLRASYPDSPWVAQLETYLDQLSPSKGENGV